MEFLFAILMALGGFIFGVTFTSNSYQENCVAKYSYMPHNQVGEYCKTILKFEKETK